MERLVVEAENITSMSSGQGVVALSSWHQHSVVGDWARPALASPEQDSRFFQPRAAAKATSSPCEQKQSSFAPALMYQPLSEASTSCGQALPEAKKE